MTRFNWQLWQRFWAIAKPYWFSEEKLGARALLAILLMLLLSVSGLEVVSSFVNRDLVTALSQKDAPRFFQLLLTFFGVVLVAITPIAAFFSYVEDKLGLYWRRWLTNHFLEKYFRQRAFYEINANPQIDNPDQRIAEDVKEFTSVALGFLLIVLRSTIAILNDS
jgi:putative ATP-binding cassette transporter